MIYFDFTNQAQGREISALVSFSGGFVATWGNLTVHIIEQLPMVIVITIIIIIIIIIIFINTFISAGLNFYIFYHNDFSSPCSGQVDFFQNFSTISIVVIVILC